MQEVFCWMANASRSMTRRVLGLKEGMVMVRRALTGLLEA
jgi:hypothetical protein